MNSLLKIVIIINFCFLAIMSPIFASEFRWQDYKPY